MSYSDLYFQPKRNHTVGIIIAGIVIALSIFIYYSSVSSTPLKAVSKNLKRHELVNLSPHEVGIFWVSDKKETGWVLFGTSNDDLSQLASDDRDVGDKKNESYLHYVPIRGLKENQQYYYKIVSGNEVISSPSKDAYMFKTPHNVSLSSNIKPAYGKINLANGQPAQNVFILYNYKNAFPFLVLTKLTGEWLIPLQFAIDKKTNEEFTMSDKEAIKIEILSENSANSVVEALVKRTNPLPQTVVLGKNYKFLEDDNVLPATTQRVVADKVYPVEIILPREKAVIPGSRPLLKGLAIPGKQVKIQINSQPGYISRLDTDLKGEWKVEVPVSLIAGTYIMTVTTDDNSNKPVILQRKFTIAKNGEQVLGAASPSATIIPSVTISPTSIVSPTISVEVTNTPIPTVTIPLYTATPVSSVTATMITPLPTSGFNGNTFLFGSLGLIIIGVSMMMVF